MPLVDRVVADRLALEVVGDREHLEVVLLEQVELGLDVAVVLGRLPGVEVVAPAGDLEAVVAPAGGELATLLERQVGPLAGEQRDRSCHRRSFSLYGGQRTPSRCSIASWSSASIATLRSPSASTSYDAARSVGERLARRERSAPRAPRRRPPREPPPRPGRHGTPGHLLAQDQVVAHARPGGLPDAVHRLGARRLEVEVDVAVVRSAAGAAEQRVDGPERAAQVAGAEPQVLVVARPVLAVEVDVEELVVPERLRDAVREVQPGHLLVPDLGVEADHLGVLELADQGQRVADRGQQDVAARLVGLRLEGEPQVVALLA